jgi:endonuclease/exonuclease/phosphatase family metal-dependent hydrolase
MRNSVYALSAILGILAVGLMNTAMADEAQKTLKVMSFNIRYGTAPDKENAWPHRKDILVGCVKQCSPDLLGLQECLRFQAAYIAEQCPEYDWFGIGREADAEGEMVTIFYRRGRLIPLNGGNFWLSETPDIPGSKSWDSSLPRIVTWCRFYDNATQRTLFHFNTHFDHRGENARRESAKLLAQRIYSLAAEELVIVTGDFNAVAEESEAYQTLTAAGLSDAWINAAERVGPTTTWSAFKAPDLNAKTRIDWILYRGGALAPERCETVTYNQDSRYPSDHYPVFATFALK